MNELIAWSFMAAGILTVVFCCKRGRLAFIVKLCVFFASLIAVVVLYNWFDQRVTINEIAIKGSMSILVGCVLGFCAILSGFRWGKPDTYLLSEHDLKEIDEASVERLEEIRDAALWNLSEAFRLFRLISLKNEDSLKKTREKAAAYAQLVEICNYKLRKLNPMAEGMEREYKEYLSAMGI